MRQKIKKIWLLPPKFTLFFQFQTLLWLTWQASVFFYLLVHKISCFLSFFPDHFGLKITGKIERRIFHSSSFIFTKNWESGSTVLHFEVKILYAKKKPKKPKKSLKLKISLLIARIRYLHHQKIFWKIYMENWKSSK